VILSAALVSLRPVGCLREDWQLWAGTSAPGIGRRVTFEKTLAALVAEPASVSISTEDVARWDFGNTGAFFRDCRNV
jgi:hypothetical protein